MALTVACLTIPARKNYRVIAEAMCEGIGRCGDKPFMVDLRTPRQADAAVMYGWRYREVLKRYRQFVYADLGYWNRESFYRVSVNAWSPDAYVKAGLSSERFDALGLRLKPWRSEGDEIIVAGSTRKAATDHGLGYQEWEQKAIDRLQGCGKRIVYRPKPTDMEATKLIGAEFDRRPISEAMRNAWAWVTHHSNSAIDALLAGVPVHCETGAAKAFSVPIEQIASPDLLPGRAQFLSDVAWLQWTLDEMRSGACWAHLKDRGLIC